jgi:hypothetical protein
VSADQRVTLAREYLTGARKRKVDHLPPSVLMRELAETRRQLGQVLAVIDSHATAVLGQDQAALVLAALEEAAGTAREIAAHCPDCDTAPASLCDSCDARLARAAEFDHLAANLREAT